MTKEEFLALMMPHDAYGDWNGFISGCMACGDTWEAGTSSEGYMSFVYHVIEKGELK